MTKRERLSKRQLAKQSQEFYERLFGDPDRNTVTDGDVAKTWRPNLFDDHNRLDEQVKFVERLNRVLPLVMAALNKKGYNVTTTSANGGVAWGRGNKMGSLTRVKDIPVVNRAIEIEAKLITGRIQKCIIGKTVQAIAMGTIGQQAGQKMLSPFELTYARFRALVAPPPPPALPEHDDVDAMSQAQA